MLRELKTPMRTALTAPGLWWACLLILILAVMYSGARVRLRTDSPYEAWDELGAYQDAAVLTEPVHWRAYTYGTLDTAKAVVARWVYERTDPVGKQWPFPIYSNNVPGSWMNPRFDFRIRDWTALSAVDFTYFRGVADRQPVLIAREINLAFLYLLVVATVVTATLLYGGNAAPVCIALLFCLTSWETLYGAEFALPNADCALFSFLLCLLCQAALGLGRPRLLYTAAVLLALGINHKVDFVALGLHVAIGAACVDLGPDGSFRRRLLHARTVALWFAGVLVATDPYLITSPLKEVHRHLAIVLSLHGPVNLDANIAVLWHFLAMNLSLTPGDPALPGRAPIVECIAVFTGLGLLPALLSKASPLARIGMLAVVLLGVGALFVMPVRNATALYERYFLNGWAALLGLAGGGVSLVLSRAIKFRRRGTALACVALLPCGLALSARFANIRKLDTIAACHLDPVTQLDDRQSRNLAIIATLKAASAGGYSSTVLIDQHAYLDLRALILAGLKPGYINAETYNEVLRYLPPGKYLTLFTKGDFEISPRWMGLWPEPIRAKYNAYIQALSGQPVLFQQAGPLMKLLDWRPPQRQDNMTVAVISVGGRAQ